MNYTVFTMYAFHELFYNDIELRSVPQDLCCSGDARRMDSTAFVVGRVDRKFGPGPSICLHFVPQGLASVVLPLVRFSRFPQRPQRLKIAFFSVHSPSFPWERLH